MIRQVLLLLVVIALNLADVATTIYGLQLGGTELNPLFFQPESLPIKIALPFVFALFFLIAYYISLGEGSVIGLRISDTTLVLLVVIYLAIVTNNLMGIVRVQPICFIITVLCELARNIFQTKGGEKSMVELVAVVVAASLGLIFGWILRGKEEAKKKRRTRIPEAEDG